MVQLDSVHKQYDTMMVLTFGEVQSKRLVMFLDEIESEACVDLPQVPDVCYNGNKRE